MGYPPDSRVMTRGGIFLARIAETDDELHQT
jgi:hypothetical protein